MFLMQNKKPICELLPLLIQAWFNGVKLQDLRKSSDNRQLI